MMNKNKKEAKEKSKNLLNICLVIFFIYIAYIIQESKIFNTRTTIYFCILITILLLFIKINFSKENFDYFINWIKKTIFKIKPNDINQNDFIKSFIMYNIFLKILVKKLKSKLEKIKY